ncbi:unnamed protein product [Agarophyton chilense]
MATSLLFSVFVLAFAIRDALATCTTPTPSPGSSSTPKPTNPPWHEGRYFFSSADAPIAKTLQTVKPFVTEVNNAIDILENVEGIILKEQIYRLSASASNLATRKPRICNLEDASWGSAAVDQMLLRGFPANLTTSCITDFEFVDAASEVKMRHVVEKVDRMVHESAQDIATAAGANFSEPAGIYDWPFKTTTEDCYVNVLGAFRTQQDWYLNIGITNWNQQKHVGEFARRYLNENIGRGVKAGPLKLYTRPKDDAINQTHVQVDATTMAVSHRGTANPAVFKDIPFRENLAVIRALDNAQVYSQQVSDALSPSSVLILVLPLWLNLIPIALLADVGNKATLMYAMLSDVLTVVPLSIKGVELISIGSAVFYGSVLRISSDTNGKQSDMAAAEIYVARCTSKRSVLPTGIAFLTVSIVFMILGLLAELVAKRYAIRHRRRMYGRISMSSTRSSSSARDRRRSRSNSTPMAETRGAQHLAMELESYDNDYDDDHRL